MRYLYGDSTPSPLKSNYLAFVRDAMEFCVHLLLAQDRIAVLRDNKRHAEEKAEAERVRITGLRALVIDAAESANTEGPESVSQSAVDRVIAASEQAIKSSLAELDAKLAGECDENDEKDREERDGCRDAFGKWIALHEPHEGPWELEAHLDDRGHYTGETSGSTSYGLDWACALELQTGHPMANGIKVGDLVTQIELAIPEPGGFLKKGKTRPQRIDAYSIDAFSTNGSEFQLRLRATPRAAIGLDVAIEAETVRVTLAGSKEVATVDVGEDDRQRLLTLRDRILEALTSHSLVRRRVTSATIDDEPLVDGEDLGAVAKRLIDNAAPIVREIRTHSLSPHELVIRRLLGNDRREEIFVSTASLLEKLGRLPRGRRSMFAPLGLEWQRVQTPLPFAAVSMPPDPVETRTIEADDPGDDDEPVIEIHSSSPKWILVDALTKEALSATVKRIVGAAREGRTTEAYEAYASLFESSDFAKLRPQDQRQAIKLMVMAKTVPDLTEDVKRAYVSVLARIRMLSDEASDPSDAELIAACEDVLASS